MRGFWVKTNKIKDMKTSVAEKELTFVLVVKKGMCFKFDLNRHPHLKDHKVKVLEKRGAKFLCNSWDGFAWTKDLYEKFELEKMVLQNKQHWLK